MKVAQIHLLHLHHQVDLHLHHQVDLHLHHPILDLLTIQDHPTLEATILDLHLMETVEMETMDTMVETMVDMETVKSQATPPHATTMDNIAAPITPSATTSLTATVTHLQDHPTLEATTQDLHLMEIVEMETMDTMVETMEDRMESIAFHMQFARTMRTMEEVEEAELEATATSPLPMQLAINSPHATRTSPLAML
jgi:hypothetical protein